jgi:hypothetical protein
LHFVSWQVIPEGVLCGGLVLGTGWTEVVALAAAYGIAALATPAGIFGAVLLLPFQAFSISVPPWSRMPPALAVVVLWSTELKFKMAVPAGRVPSVPEAMPPPAVISRRRTRCR